MAGRVLAPLRTITAAASTGSRTRTSTSGSSWSGPQDELRRLADTIDRLLERLEVAFEAQRRFVANASHELRTPLATMRTTLDVAMAKPAGVPEQTRELDAELRVDLDQVDRLLESFLSLARAQDGGLGERSQVALEPLISAALAARADELAGRHLDVETHLTPLEVSGSETLLRRMLENVIENAVRHNTPAGSIEITLARLDGGRARLTVDMRRPGSRTGRRRPARGSPSPCASARTARTPNSGHGLGLSIVAAIAAAHNGTRLEPPGTPRGRTARPGSRCRSPRFPDSCPPPYEGARHRGQSLARQPDCGGSPGPGDGRGRRVRRPRGHLRR